MKVPLYDLQQTHKEYADEVESAVLKVLRSGQYVSGPEVELFEESFARYLSAPYVVAVSSGTAALHLALLALGVKPRDEVIVPSFTFAAAAEAVLYCGGVPVFVDISADTYTIDPEAVRDAVSLKTVGVIPVHLYGHMADMESLRKIAKTHGLWIVEDACQAHGAMYKDEKAGTFGNNGVFSFYPTKNLGGFGEGGAVVTKDVASAEFLRKARNHGSKERYVHEVLGYNYRLSEIQAAALNVKLPFINEWNEKRRQIAQLYQKAFQKLPIKLPQEKNDCYHVYHQYIIQVKDRDHLRSYLHTNGIQTEIFYATPLHRQPAFSRKCRIFSDLSMSEELAQEVVSLPISPVLTNAQVEYVIEKITNFFA